MMIFPFGRRYYNLIGFLWLALLERFGAFLTFYEMRTLGVDFNILLEIKARVIMISPEAKRLIGFM
jgi:hypothetical protein